MKKLLAAAIVTACVSLNAFAGQQVTLGKTYKPTITPAEACFADQELTIDAFGFYQDAESGSPYTDGWGGGIGVNYFFARHVGLGVEGYWSDQSEDDTVIHSVTGSLILRFPIDSICLAPYVFGGGGGHFDSENIASGHAGGGLEYRVTPTIGIFGDARYVWTGDDANDKGLYRVGLRFVF